MINFESLLYRIKDDPLSHLGRCSVGPLQSYFIGYDDARRVWQQPEVPRRLPRERFLDWQISKVHLCNQNLQSFCQLLTDDEESAFELYFKLYDGALEECKDELLDVGVDPHVSDLSSATKTSTLVDFICMEPFRKRPAMYFGNQSWITGLWAMCSGFLWAERDMAINESSDAKALRSFQLWLDERYPIAKGRNWDRLFDFRAIHYNDRALELFFEDFDLFIKGEPSNVQPNWIGEAVENAAKHMESNKAGD